MLTVPRVSRWSLLCVALLATAAQAVEIRNTRIWSGPDNTRVVFDLSGIASNRLASSKSPNRVTLDIPNAHLKHGRASVMAGRGPVTRVRFSALNKKTLRVVIELSQPVLAKSFLAAPDRRNGYRLVLELATAADVVRAAATAKPKLAARAPAPANALKPDESTPIKIEHAPAAARDLVIAVDAGHGGEDPGATGMNGTREKTVVLAIARELERQIDAEPGMHAVLTRDGDYFVELRDRMRRARQRQADLFVSVHADSIADRSVSGSSVYILSQRGASDEAARWLAERENAADLVGGVKLENKDNVLASVLLDVSQNAALNASHTAAGNVLRQLDQVGDVRKRQVQQARFLVLKSPDIPSMLVETAYISNPVEERRLREHDSQARIAAAIQHGVKDYFYANPPSGTRVAQRVAAPTADFSATAGNTRAVN
jgi:N-acetylmuramoyl-L-alanine amidase